MDFIYFIYDTKFYKSKELIELLKEIVFNDLFAYLFFITIHSLIHLKIFSTILVLNSKQRLTFQFFYDVTFKKY